MKKLLIGLMLALGFVLTAPLSQADADSDSWSDSGSGYTNGMNVPELDASVAGSAMVLLLGGAAYMVSRRRKND